MKTKKRTDQNRDYQRQYRERRRKEGYVPINIFIRKALRDKIAKSGIPLEDFINDAVEERVRAIPAPSTRMKEDRGRAMVLRPRILAKKATISGIQGAGFR